MTIYAFGDIEGDHDIFESTITSLDHITTTDPSARVIFLGDIYTHVIDKNITDNDNGSIAMIEAIYTRFEPLRDIVNDDTTPIDIARIFRKLWKDKQLQIYSKTCRQIWRRRPKIPPEGYPRDFSVIYLFGNKEVEFITDVSKSRNIESSYDDRLGTTLFAIPTEYFDKRLHSVRRSNNVYTAHQLNVMCNYLSRCVHTHVEDAIAYMHCYFNGNMLDGVKAVVSGHCKGYGKFIDVCRSYEVYIVDLTRLHLDVEKMDEDDAELYRSNDDVDRKGLNNYMSIGVDGMVKTYNDELYPFGLKDTIARIH